VDALVRDGWLHIAVVNPVAADEAPAGGHGVGLKNIRERLAVLYGARARIAWQRSETQFAIEINLPADKEVIE
jgi:two-component system sensor histidine kinase AlgZ